jgi:hypothetical protein
MEPRKIRLLGRVYTLVFTCLKKHACLGFCDDPALKRRKIWIETSLRNRRELQILIHEMLHAVDWHKDEDSFIHPVSRDIAKVLWDLGYRRQGRMLIGLTGYAGVGKDAFADVLVEHGFTKLGFADPMYRMATDLNGYVRRVLADCKGDWTEAKKRPAVRGYLQDLGQAGRDHIGPDVWVNALFAKVEADNVVVTNVRYENEAKGILDRDGVIIRIDRQGVGAVNEHSSDAGLAFPFASLTVHNNGTLEDLRRIALEVTNARL